LKDPGLRAEFGAASRRLAEERFSDRQVVSRILDLYRELLAEKNLAVWI
jgi:glycosyltransferase involved in cell wall biosynthesis